LYERYYNAAVALAYSTLGEIHGAEDAAQESFAIACRDLGKLKSKEKFGAWLGGICRNVARQMKRREGLGKDLAGRMAQNTEADEEDTQMIRRAVWQLGDRDREIIVLRYYDNLSYERISDVLGISQQAVNGRIIRAKKKISKVLKQNGFSRG
jgi:RNA polymerase sigma-70 factor (ECF subfamily)